MITEEVPAKRFPRNCLACGRSTTHCFLWEKSGSPVFRCTECGLGSANKGSFDPKSYYTANFFNGNTEGGYPDYVSSENVLRAEFRAIVDRAQQMIPSGTLIEVGAAYGFFLLEAKAHYQVYGVEIAGEAAQFARARGLDVRTGSLTRQLLEEIGPIDVAVMLDVIEHLEHPKATLALCSEFLRPGGILILTTPDFASTLARLTGKSWRNMTPPQHLWYFTPGSIRRVAAAAGLEVYQITHPWKRVPISLIVQLISRYTGLAVPRSVLSPLSKVGLPVNLFDAMRVVLRKPRSGCSTATSDLTPGNAPAGFVKVGRISELDGAGQFSRWVGNHDILVFRRHGVIRAFSNVCPHFGGPVGYHQFTDGTFTCLWHNLQYDADTGQCLSVAKFKLREYKLTIKDGEIFANLVANGDSK